MFDVDEDKHKNKKGDFINWLYIYLEHVYEITLGIIIFYYCE